MVSSMGEGLLRAKFNGCDQESRVSLLLLPREERYVIAEVL
jgi:hypothetical protein